MIAFVLSGGGNRGPLEVGALQVLLEHGIRPDVLVGASAGAINAAFLGLNPTAEAALELGDLWEGLGGGRVFRGNRFTMLWRWMAGKDSLYPNDRLRELVEQSLPPGVERFGDISGVKLYIVATRLETGEPRVFGDDPGDRLLDAIMASTALPPFFPPWRYEGELLVDGAIAADLPIKIAINRGAKKIYALHLVDVPANGQQRRGLLNIAERAINNMLSRQLETELGKVKNTEGVTLHYVPLTGFYNLPLWDFSCTREMIDGGRQQMEEYLRSSDAVGRRGRLSLPKELAQKVGRAVLGRLQGLPIRKRKHLEGKLESHSGVLELRP